MAMLNLDDATKFRKFVHLLPHATTGNGWRIQITEYWYGYLRATGDA